VDGHHQSELGARTRETGAQPDLVRQHAASDCERAQQLASRLVQNFRRGEGRQVGDYGDAFSLRLARVPQAVSLVRHELRRWLDAVGVSPEDALDIMLACSEACANAVEHPGRSGRPAFDVEARRGDGEVRVAVRDFGAWAAVGEGTGRGRGLGMMRAIMDAVEIIPGVEGTQVVMHRTLRPAH
jgi:anti-sigma regulatory factor (Ser/Thr protein kinase)